MLMRENIKHLNALCYLTSRLANYRTKLKDNLGPENKHHGWGFTIWSFIQDAYLIIMTISQEDG